MLPRTNFHSSKLLRSLADLSLVESIEPTQTFAEQLGQWVHFADAITLSTVHSEMFDKASAKCDEMAQQHYAAADAEFKRVQLGLTDAIIKSCMQTPSKPQINLRSSLAAPAETQELDHAAIYTAYRRVYEAQQRDMALRIPPLRSNLREALAQASPKLKKLAALDVILEKILQERETLLLAKLPLLLKKHFENLLKQDLQKNLASQAANQTANLNQVGAWRAQFCHDMQILLLAELDLRLQPALGLLEAFKLDTQ